MRLLLVLLCGCSFAFTEKPNADTPEEPCNASEAAPIADAAFAVAYAIVAFEMIQEMNREYSDDDAAPVAVMSGILGAIHGGGAAYGFNNIGKCRRHNNELYDQQVAAANAPPPVPRSRRDAWQLTKQAALAARNGDCATVATLEQVVLGIDTEFHGTVFMRDAAIQRCMTSTEVPIAPPGETPSTAPVAPPLAPAQPPATP